MDMQEQVQLWADAFGRYLLVLARHDVGHAQVGQDYGAYIQDLQMETRFLPAGLRNSTGKTGKFFSQQQNP